MLSTSLPVYRDTYKLVSLLVDYVGCMNKKFKYSIGDKITKTSLDLFEYLQLANRAIDNKQYRIKMLDGFLIKFELLKVLLRLCNEKQLFSLKQCTRVAELTELIERQIYGWKKSTEADLKSK